MTKLPTPQNLPEILKNSPLSDACERYMQEKNDLVATKEHIKTLADEIIGHLKAEKRTACVVNGILLSIEKGTEKLKVKGASK